MLEAEGDEHYSGNDYNTSNDQPNYNVGDEANNNYPVIVPLFIRVLAWYGVEVGVIG